MKNKSLHHKLQAAGFVVAAMLFLLAGCYGGPSINDEVIAKYQPKPPQKVEEIDAEIAKIKRHIDELSEYETQQRQIAVINSVADYKSRSWTKGDSQPSYEELAEQANAQAVATEKEIQRLERQVAKLEKEKQTILSQSTGCFPPDALVKMEDGTFKAFEDIAPGDTVQTFDIGDERVVSRPVAERYQVDANHLYTINGELMTTGGERLLTPAGWKKVRDLEIGDAVHVDGRMLEIVSIDYQRVSATLFNLQVEDTHNFYVVTASGARYLVHNTSGGGSGGGGGGGAGGGGGSK